MHRLVVFVLIIALVQADNNGNGNGNNGNGNNWNPYAAVSCNTIVGCLGVSKAPSFVTCNTTTNKCQCKPEFDGNATIVSQCRCDDPKQVYFQLGTSSPLNSASITDASLSASLIPAEWGVTTVRCVDFLGLEAAEAKNQQHIASVIKFFNNTIYPKPQTILQNQNLLLDILSPTVKSRISPAGSFDGFEGVVEYFYGFVAQPGLISQKVDIRSIAATGNTVAVKANILIVNGNYAQSGGFPPQFFNLSIFGFFTFDNNDKISSIDVSVPNLGKLLDVVGPAQLVQQLQQGRIQFICQLLTLPSALSTNTSGTCGWYDPYNAGPNPGVQFQACVTFMNSIAYGSFNRMNANNFACRYIHALLTVSGPAAAAAHCPHVSIGGGGACIEFSYESFFQVEY
jgi:hypothetical protein